MAAKAARKTTKKSSTPKKQAEPVIEYATAEITKSSNMPKTRLLLIGLLVLVLVALIYKFRGQFIVATVNGKPITRVEVWKELEKQGGKSVLDSLVTKELVMEDAAKKGIKVSDDDVNKEISSYEDELKKQNQTLDSMLTLQGMTRSTFADQVRFRQIIMKLLADKLNVGDDEVSKYMTDNKLTVPAGTNESDFKASLKQQLQQQKLSSVFQSYIDGLKSGSKIQYLYNY